MDGRPSTLSMMYPMLAMGALTAIPTIGFGVYDRIDAKRKEKEQQQQLAQWYAMQQMQNQGGPR